eukprot:CAMPEP_0185738028 /NCGR_PEP_ID=MMETSP1171-20130828/31863_1 /TAXON_ID=374046 /ORGANISM="Helicotheca tamensis, Strain CCMP826" /LENGTH=49 /DNA_ID= /DNA_START= /DNA_END= /DNA_ORIENTATION=
MPIGNSSIKTPNPSKAPLYQKKMTTNHHRCETGHQRHGQKCSERHNMPP